MVIFWCARFLCPTAVFIEINTLYTAHRVSLLYTSLTPFPTYHRDSDACLSYSGTMSQSSGELYIHFKNTKHPHDQGSFDLTIRRTGRIFRFLYPPHHWGRRMLVNVSNGFLYLKLCHRVLYMSRPPPSEKYLLCSYILVNSPYLPVHLTCRWRSWIGKPFNSIWNPPENGVWKPCVTGVQTSSEKKALNCSGIVARCEEVVELTDVHRDVINPSCIEFIQTNYMTKAQEILNY